MQLFLAVGGAVGTVAVEVTPSSPVASLRQYLSQLLPAQFVLQTRLLFAGRQLRKSELLGDVGLQHGSTVQVACRLRGGGGDGGSTGAESRSCYLEMYLGKKPDKVNPAEEKLARFTRCQISGETLSSPCVIDELGMLYNKDALIHALLNKSIPQAVNHITGLKSVVELKLQQNTAQGTTVKQQGSSAVATNESQFCCPITGLEFNGRFRFVVHRPTGLVVSERALKEIPSAVEDLFGGKWSESDLIVVNPTGEELELIREKLSAKLAAEREKKKSKKHKLSNEVQANDNANSNNASGHHANGNNASGHHANGEAKPVVVAKKMRTFDFMPVGATKEVFASLFDSSIKNPAKETYLCRNTGARGFRQV